MQVINKRSMKPIYFHVLLFLGFLSVGGIQVVQGQTVLPPTQTDEIIIDNGATGKADPADRIRYTVTIINTGGSGANAMQFNAVPDPRTTFVGGSFRSSPLAVPDMYTSTGNVGIIVNAASGLKANDFDDNIPGLSITAGTFATTQSGSIMISADGSFMYTPPAGFTGTDTYTYTLVDGNPVGLPVPATDAGTISITVSNLIWFIDNSAAAGDGRLGTPFNSLAAFNSGSAAAADVVYIEHTGPDYTGVITLANGERLFGEGHTGGANLSNVLPFTLAPNSKTLPTINGTRPTITNAAGNGIALAMNNGVRGINVANTTGTDITGSNFGTLTLSEVVLSGTGQALNLSAGTLAATFISITSTSSGTQGINLAGVSGSMTSTDGTTISGSTTQGILVGTTTANINFGNTTIAAGTDGISLQNNSAGTRTFGTLSITNGTGVGFLHAVGGGLTNITGLTTITNPGGRGIDIQNAVAANGVTFANANITQTGGTGVHLANNAGNVVFADLDITPDANQRALNAIDNTGSITTTSGTFTNSGAIGIEITKATGATPLAMVLTSVSVTGTTNGINLLRTSGSFAIVGSASTNGSGGTIQNITARGAAFTTASGITLKNIIFTNANSVDAGTCGASDNSGCNAAIYLNAVTNAVLDNMDITTTVQQGINVRETSGLQILNSTISNTGTNVEESGLYAHNIFGTAEITNSTFSFPGDRAAVIYNVNKNLTMTVSGSQFNDTQTSATGADGFEFNSLGTSITDLDITNCSFLRDKTNGVQFLTESTSQGTVDITGCTVDPQAGVGAGLEVASNGTSVLKFNIHDNPNVKARLTTVINCFAQGNSTMEGQVHNNIVSSLAGSGSGIRAVASADGDVKIKITNNTVSNIALDNGITTVANSGTGRMDATITGNNVAVLSTAAFNIQVVAGASSSTFTNKTCGNVANNIVSPPSVGGMPIANFQGRAATPSHELLIQGTGPMTNMWNANGNMPTSPTALVLQTGTGTFTFGATCLLPSYP